MNMYPIKCIVQNTLLKFGIIARFSKISRIELKKHPHQINVNIGAGNFKHPFFINLDNPSKYYRCYKRYTDVEYDIFSFEKLPFDDDSVDLYYCSHVLEHITDDSLNYFLKEVRRTLKKGGLFRVIVPDISLLYNAYKLNDRALLFPIIVNNNLINASIQQLFIWSFARQRSIHHPKSVSPLSNEDIDNLFLKGLNGEILTNVCKKCDVSTQKEYPEDHLNWFDYLKLEKMLRKAGFITIYRSAYKQSKCELLRNESYFDNTAPEISLFVECYKGAED